MTYKRQLLFGILGNRIEKHCLLLLFLVLVFASTESRIKFQITKSFCAFFSGTSWRVAYFTHDSRHMQAHDAQLRRLIFWLP